jgi:hypothetical protein
MLALSDATNHKPPGQDKVSEYLLKEPRILREVCRAMRSDDNGRQCPTCCVREFCESQARRAGDASAALSHC